MRSGAPSPAEERAELRGELGQAERRRCANGLVLGACSRERLLGVDELLAQRGDFVREIDEPLRQIHSARVGDLEVAQRLLDREAIQLTLQLRLGHFVPRVGRDIASHHIFPAWSTSVHPFALSGGGEPEACGTSARIPPPCAANYTDRLLPTWRSPARAAAPDR